jgi:hypothetical protein
VRCQCVGPTIPDNGNLLPATTLIKPALLSYRDVLPQAAQRRRATLASRLSSVIRS